MRDRADLVAGLKGPGFHGQHLNGIGCDRVRGDYGEPKHECLIVILPVWRKPLELLVPKALFFPGIAPHVVAVPLPKSGLVIRSELYSCEPLSALPGI